MSEAIERFRIHVEDGVLDDLRERLVRTRPPDAIPGSGWEYGTDREYLGELLRYWREGFDWRAQEELLNDFAHYRTRIGGNAVHFVNAPSPVPEALPLLITHGWPGSVFEFYKVIGPLSDPERHGGRGEDAFHVVCPSIPGYGFSGPTRQQGIHVRRVAEIDAQLMARLGYARNGVQGGTGGPLRRCTTQCWIGTTSAESISTWWWRALQRTRTIPCRE